ncbi:methionine ABC transporter ATP-binding protein [Mammaliicoccus vitulinus]|uniref:methionine ABC transporter permease n=1 Tax=Mammaliicoccus vitulinus TaxID=71237 RepID=UPI000D1E2BC6|nr:ABC transporter permease subunit [Mammaliicoccus vitulinus]PTI37893.1 methionine ABC transporter ATP-binding protein [Mammaliicoccus vitulinus]
MTFLEKINYYLPELIQSLQETCIMLGYSMIMTLLIGLPLGIALFLSNPSIKELNINYYCSFNFLITFIRSFPYLLFVISLIPLTRLILGSAFGPYPSIIPLSIVGIAIFSRLVEQVLLDIPGDIKTLAESLGATKLKYIWNFILVESRSGIILAYTTTTVSMVSYSTVMGIVGGGGIGDFAIRYGYQSYENEVMYFSIIIIIISVFIIQMLGNNLSRKLDKRK